MFMPPHSPLSVDTTIAPTRFTRSRLFRNGWRYSVFAFAMWMTMLKTRSRYGRDARIRSWAFFIFEAATISIALVILRVLCTLLILPRISFDPAIVASVSFLRRRPGRRRGLRERYRSPSAGR